jgi:hypothetical protein
LAEKFHYCSYILLSSNTWNDLKQGDALSPLRSKFVLEYAARSVQVNQHGLILNGTHQLMVYVDDVKTYIGRERM